MTRLVGEDVKRVLDGISAAVSGAGVSLKFECENFETVYLELGDGDAICVSDGRKTLKYLAEGRDPTFDPLTQLDITSVRQVCAALAVSLIPGDGDPPEAAGRLMPSDGHQYQGIGCQLALEAPVGPAISRVAEAIERVFELASNV